MVRGAGHDSDIGGLTYKRITKCDLVIGRQVPSPHHDSAETANPLDNRWGFYGLVGMVVYVCVCGGLQDNTCAEIKMCTLSPSPTKQHHIASNHSDNQLVVMPVHTRHHFLLYYINSTTDQQQAVVG
jgi:hypothetical protein